jgi:hypothetical protein
MVKGLEACSDCRMQRLWALLQALLPEYAHLEWRAGEGRQ